VLSNHPKTRDTLKHENYDTIPQLLGSSLTDSITPIAGRYVTLALVSSSRRSAIHTQCSTMYRLEHFRWPAPTHDCRSSECNCPDVSVWDVMCHVWLKRGPPLSFTDSRFSKWIPAGRLLDVLISPDLVSYLQIVSNSIPSISAALWHLVIEDSPQHHGSPDPWVSVFI
jgi:hypothetical protein